MFWALSFHLFGAGCLGTPLLYPWDNPYLKESFANSNDLSKHSRSPPALNSNRAQFGHHQALSQKPVVLPRSEIIFKAEHSQDPPHQFWLASVCGLELHCRTSDVLPEGSLKDCVFAQRFSNSLIFTHKSLKCMHWQKLLQLPRAFLWQTL